VISLCIECDSMLQTMLAEKIPYIYLYIFYGSKWHLARGDVSKVIVFNKATANDDADA